MIALLEVFWEMSQLVRAKSRAAPEERGVPREKFAHLRRYFREMGPLAAGPCSPGFFRARHLDFDASKSDFGPMPIPIRGMVGFDRTDQRRHLGKAPCLSTKREAHYEFSYKFDGSEVVNESSANHSRSRTHWDGGFPGCRYTTGSGRATVENLHANGSRV